jgi:hypothetical protein
LNRTVTQRAKDKAASGDMSREAADRLAIERGEDDGMIVHQGVTSNVQNSKEILHDIPTR